MVKKVKIKEEIAKRMECLVKFQKVANHFSEKLRTDFGARMFKNNGFYIVQEKRRKV
jgi:hypothetical protein